MEQSENKPAEVTGDIYWTFERNGKIFDAQLTSAEEAQEFADDKFQDECQSIDEMNAEDEIEILKFTYNEFTGEIVILERTTSSVEYEYYHGDRVEHSTYHKGGSL